MNSKLIRVLLVDADHQETGALPRRMSEVEGIDVVGVAYNRNAALSQVEELQPAVLVVDLMLPGILSIDLIRYVSGDHSQVCILALALADPPLAIGVSGTYFLQDDRIEGENLLALFGPNAPAHLRRTDSFTNCPDIQVNSFYDPENNEGCAFEELIGFHGGMGGTQTQPFLLHPVKL